MERFRKIRIFNRGDLAEFAKLCGGVVILTGGKIKLMKAGQKMAVLGTALDADAALEEIERAIAALGVDREKVAISIYSNGRWIFV
jgi:hypothetical protein